jgi:hypothetical protein
MGTSRPKKITLSTKCGPSKLLKGHHIKEQFTLGAKVERPSDSSNLIGQELKINPWNFTLGAKVQGPKATKILTWQHFSRVLVPRVQPLEENLDPPIIETQTLVEGLNISFIKVLKI